jgi:two-component system, LytTR family, sensor histidine kinase AlgZ
MIVTTPLRPRVLTRRYLIRIGLANVIAAIGAVGIIVWLGLFTSLSDVGYSLATSLIYASVMGSLCGFVLPFVTIAVERQPAVLKFGAIAAALAVLIFIGCVLGTVITVLVGINTAEGARKVFSLNLRISLTLGFGAAFVVTGYETLRGRLHATELELRSRQLEEERAKNLAAEARLSSLASRIHPHFLFNTLNSVSALIHEDPDRAEEMVGRLAALLRFSLDANQRSLTPLEQELKIVRDYLEIEKARFGERLRYSIEAPAELRNAEVPLLAVQTLVENSVKHVVAARREGGEIFVRVRALNGGVAVDVSDDGPGFAMAEAPAAHGLDNLMARLRALYPDGAGVETMKDERGRAAVCVRVPARPA